MAILGTDGRTSKPRRLRADLDDPIVGDAILLSGSWHEVVRVAHLPDERAATVGAVVVCQPMAAPPGWLLDLARGGRTVPPTEPGKVLPMRDPFTAPTVEREVRPSQLRTVEYDASQLPAPVEQPQPTGRAFVVEAERTSAFTMRMLLPAGARVVERATGIHERPTAIAYPRPPLVARPPAPPQRKRSRLPWLVVPLVFATVALGLAWWRRPRHVAPAALPSVRVIAVEPYVEPPATEAPPPGETQPEATPAPAKRHHRHKAKTADTTPAGDAIFEAAP